MNYNNEISAMNGNNRIQYYGQNYQLMQNAQYGVPNYYNYSANYYAFFDPRYHQSNYTEGSYQNSMGTEMENNAYMNFNVEKNKFRNHKMQNDNKIITNSHVPKNTSDKWRRHNQSPNAQSHVPNKVDMWNSNERFKQKGEFNSNSGASQTNYATEHVLHTDNNQKIVVGGSNNVMNPEYVHGMQYFNYFQLNHNYHGNNSFDYKMYGIETNNFKQNINVNQNTEAHNIQNFHMYNNQQYMETEKILPSASNESDLQWSEPRQSADTGYPVTANNSNDSTIPVNNTSWDDNADVSTENRYVENLENENNVNEKTNRHNERHDRSTSQSRRRGRSHSSDRRCDRSRSKERHRFRSRSRSRNRYRSRSKSRSRCRSRSKLVKSKDRHHSVSRDSSRGRERRRRRRRSSSRERAKNKKHSRSKCDSEVDKSSNGFFGRRKLIEKWRLNNCDTRDEMHKRLEEISLMNPDEILAEENKVRIRSAPADVYYARDENDLRKMKSTPSLDQLCQRFKYELVERGARVKATQTLKCPSPPKPRRGVCKHLSHSCSSSDDDSDFSESDDDSDDMNEMVEEMQRKQLHPYRLHRELWFNDPGEMNDGPLCRCSPKARRSGIRHGFYPGEDQKILCDIKSNNAGNLYHYRITISPPTNFLTRTPTIINHDDHEFIFEGFSLISHYPIEKLPVCKVIRFNIEYIILYVEEKLPDNFTIEELDLFSNYLFKEVLELVDFDLSNSKYPDNCPQFHFMPRFVRELPDNGRELLPMCEVLKYLLDSNKKLIEDDFLSQVHKISNHEWQNFADAIKGMVVTIPGMKPCSLRVDQLDRDCDEVKDNKKDDSDFFKESGDHSIPSPTQCNDNDNCVGSTSEKVDNVQKLSSEKVSNKTIQYPEIVHFGVRPSQLSYAKKPEYQKAWREYLKFRHLLANMPKPTIDDKQTLALKETRLQLMRSQNKMKRDVTVTVSSEGFYLTGLMCDVVQHAMLIPVLVCHLRFHRSVSILEEKIKYKFKNRFLLQLALTHPSYRENFGTNPDHARNSLTNCGIRQPEYGDRRIHYMNTRKRGINTLISIMSRFGKKSETQSNIYHNERLEFLGDAVVEFVTTIHLFHIFRDLEEGGLATYRAALVQNQHLALLARKLKLDEFMLYAHGSDLCHDLELKHAMANCFEALMGALFLDGGIEVAGKVFGETLYGDDEDCLDIWFNYSPHPLQEQEPLGDRRWISEFPFLQKLTEFEESIGIEFKHIRLLARAFTDRSIGYTNLTLGSNQRLEFLGDSVLQLIASDYLYKYFPEHHEGHLSLLRSSLVNNKTQAVVCDDLGMTKYAMYANPKVELKVKDRADLLEAFLAALYVDRGLEICRVFCDVCFFPRLQDFIMNQDWNDPKSKLQQCCLTQRTLDGGEPDIPIYKVVECKGPTNTRLYTVAVYFRNKRLAEATGHSIQQAEMNAAQKAMEVSGPLFPQLDYQKRVIAKSLRTQKWPNNGSGSTNSSEGTKDAEGKKKRKRKHRTKANESSKRKS